MILTIALLLSFQLAGLLLVTLFGLPIPGPVMGMVLFLTLTVSSWGNPCSVWGCAPFFIVPNML